MKAKSLDDILLELEAEGVAVSEEDVIDEIEYQAHELEMHNAMHTTKPKDETNMN